MENFILDTNVFFNMKAGFSLGKKTEEVVKNITKKIKILKKLKKAEFYMPPSIISEFLSFFEDKNQEFLKDFLSVINVVSPDKSKFLLSVEIFYKLISDIRERSYRGMNIAEEEMISAVTNLINLKPKNKIEFQKQTGVYIKKFRDHYRKATREGFLDSVADLDLIVLAKEKDGFLVSSDQGVIGWAREFGVKEMPCVAFAKHLEFLLLPHQEQDLKENQ